MGELPLSSVLQASAPLLSLSSQNNGAEVCGRGGEGFWQPDLLLNRVTVGKRARYRSQAALSGRGQKAYTQLQQHQLQHQRHRLMHASAQEDLLSLTNVRSTGVISARGRQRGEGSSYPCCCLHVPQERRLDPALRQLRTPPEIKAKMGRSLSWRRGSGGGFRVNVYRVDSADEASPHSLCVGALVG